MKKKKRFTRFTFLKFVTVFIIICIEARLVFLQVVNNEYYTTLENTTMVRTLSEAAPRGTIKDRNGLALTKNKETYMLNFVETQDSNKSFFTTMDELFKILDTQKETQEDDFPLKINPYAFDFKDSDENSANKKKLRFLEDRGFKEKVTKEMFKTKAWNDLKDDEKSKVEDKILQVTPEECFNQLWENYTKPYLNSKTSQQLKNQINSYSLEQKRRLMIVKDDLYLQKFSGYASVVISKNIDRPTYLIVEQELYKLPGVNVSFQPVRTYPYKDLASNIIGYMSRITDPTYDEKGYDINSDLIGASGIESVFENYLKGSNGENIMVVNGSGQPKYQLGKKESRPGHDIQLTIDSKIQYTAEKALEDTMAELQQKKVSEDNVSTANATRGAVAVIDVNTGAILALASKPNFDPNDFPISGSSSQDLLKKYFSPDLGQWGMDYIQKNGLLYKNPGKSTSQLLDILFPKTNPSDTNSTQRNDPYDLYPKSLYNYAVGLITPGSSFKPVTGIAGLESGAINSGYTYDDEAYFDLGGNNNPKDFVHFTSDGANHVVNIQSAIAKSSNPFFMSVGQRLGNQFGLDKLAEYAWKLGLGVDPNSGAKASTGIEIPESFGQVYNTSTIANRDLNQITSQLKKGKFNSSKNTYPAIDISNNDNDSADIKSTKKDIQNYIISCIRAGHTKNKQKDSDINNKFVELLNKLISIDSQYKDKKISNDQISSIASLINKFTYNCDYSQYTLPYNLLNASYGQGDDRFTPLQLADYLATLINGGNRYKLHLVDKITDGGDGSVTLQNKPEILNTTGFNQKNIDLIKQGMLKVVTEGTAAGVLGSFYSETGIQTAGKTGTATLDQVKINGTEIITGRSPYSVYIGFAPYDKPEIAVCSVVFDGGYGVDSSQIDKAIYETYFKDRILKYNPNYQFKYNFQN